MSDGPAWTPITRSEGVTASEQYLRALCDRTFLSMWSYPRLFVKKITRNVVSGRELCDLLVLFEDTVLIFSDKGSEFGPTAELELSWSRWFRATVTESARQARGAERRLRKGIALFLDQECTKPFHLQLDPARIRVHLIVVAHGASKACAEVLGGSGSFLIRTDLHGDKAHTVPFAVGDLDPTDTFVHVLDDMTLDVVMQARDTITDFTHYLQKKETFLRAGRPIAVDGEEDLLAIYLQTVTNAGEHDLVILPKATGSLTITGSFWSDFIESPQRKNQIEHDAISYSWDILIEKFSHHALRGDQLDLDEDDCTSSSESVIETERVMRFMAREPRTRRRILARDLNGLVEKTKADTRGIYIIGPSIVGDPYYAFLAFPAWTGDWTGAMTAEYRQYRRVRRYVLHSLMLTVKLKYPDSQHIVGIATESGLDAYPRTEDFGYVDGGDWCDHLQQEAVVRQLELGLMKKVRTWQRTVQEFPAVTLEGRLLFPPGKNPRNTPCPCGSGLKFKRCHGR